MVGRVGVEPMTLGLRDVYILIGLHRVIMKTQKIRKLHNSLILLVPGAGIEPARGYPRGILSPLRLPIPPPGQLD